MVEDKAVHMDSSYSLVLWLVYYLCLLQKQHYIPNVAVAALLQFLSVFFGVIAQISPQISGISRYFPRTLQQLEKLMGTQPEGRVRYVYCEKCSSIFSYNDCILKIGSEVQSKVCKYRFSNGSQSCNGALLKCVERPNKSKVFYPLKIYCYTPLYNYISVLVKRPGFCDLCDHWKGENKDTDALKDVYDEKVWSNFLTYDGGPFLLGAYTYALMLNIDWFKPCKHTEYSVGAVYLTIMNLPRRIRFRQENAVLIGLIPGPKEPKRDVNTVLGPLVEELLKFWDGVKMTIFSDSASVLVRCVLLCVAFDIPASRKVCGFLGHSAILGCSKCLKKFPGPVGQRDYSGFDRTQWPKRTLAEHRKNIYSIRKSSTITG
ncbi:hypothetical protein SPONN_2359 [uncultured Candidatus Thioglobus sp.]|nr:hypothetical protein SPONN_2359 [uncultured Candidatus Thioglobus sp.]